jgi:7,8-dihydroneopterin aldolase/epimerase/oxygenase
MDIVFISDLDIDTVIGIYDWEREIRQTVRLNIEMNTDVKRAAATDKIEDALDYKAVAKRLIGFVEKSEFGLVETLGERCAEIILEEFPVQWVRLKLDKPGAVRGRARSASRSNAGSDLPETRLPEIPLIGAKDD